MADKIFTGFGIRNLWIATPAAPPVWLLVPEIVSATYKGAITEVEQTGGDEVIDQWYTAQKGSITVKASRASLQVFNDLSGVTKVDNTSFQVISFGRPEELLPPIVSVRGMIVGKDDSLNKVHIITYWYKCHTKSVFEAFPDSAYGKLTEVTVTFTALQSLADETNTALATRAIGRIEVWVASVSPYSAYE